VEHFMFHMGANAGKTPPMTFREYLRRFHYDYLTYHPEGLRFLIDIVGTDRIVVGTDSFNAKDIEYPSAVSSRKSHGHQELLRVNKGQAIQSAVRRPRPHPEGQRHPPPAFVARGTATPGCVAAALLSAGILPAFSLFRVPHLRSLKVGFASFRCTAMSRCATIRRARPAFVARGTATLGCGAAALLSAGILPACCFFGCPTFVV
jgi:hypothetical protein